ncbi:HepT-like ribonuclease domain-containing protein [Sphingobium sp. D43FB]|uniref:HepT-like ribonuclease domain-containing protein n=1 Tax=Sphingobium sp. D43FB TaxID=2017595 RepID=UPI000BB53B56|nr:HepT-like ribonuclease domain-containing protein [Sphingobium sp. D43FB]PBN41969.1 hypothetical protein SxD43FB_18750 [Sphingobium sp. D43FB]
MLAEDRDLAYLQTIVLLAERIKTHLDKVTVAQFMDSYDDIDLLSYRLSMVGEYANKLSASFRASHDHMPWIAMIGLRNIVAHEYARVDPSRIWATATNELAALEKLCRDQIELRES